MGEADNNRFWSRVDRSDGQGPTGECWEWTGNRDRKGYGSVGNDRATHLSLAISGRPRRTGMLALHSCDNPPCVNPAHLRWGTPAENIADMVKRKRHGNLRKTHCRYGHALDGDNVIAHGHGWRACRTCKQVNMRASRALGRIAAGKSARNSKTVIISIATIADAIAKQAGVDATKTAGAIVSYLAEHLDEIDHVLTNGVIDLGDDWVKRGRFAAEYGDPIVQTHAIGRPNVLSRAFEVALKSGEGKA